MRTRTLPLEDYWTTLARVLPDFSAEQQHTAVTIYRELANGKPLTIERVASVLDHRRKPRSSSRETHFERSSTPTRDRLRGPVWHAQSDE